MMLISKSKANISINVEFLIFVRLADINEKIYWNKYRIKKYKPKKFWYALIIEFSLYSIKPNNIKKNFPCRYSNREDDNDDVIYLLFIWSTGILWKFLIGTGYKHYIP